MSDSIPVSFPMTADGRWEFYLFSLTCSIFVSTSSNLATIGRAVPSLLPSYPQVTSAALAFPLFYRKNSIFMPGGLYYHH